ncbi:MAG: universal stress protein [Flavobacteriales bacterium]|nr:MAG: universal stress protein [Flavobacteriales bacterium]
MKRILVPVDFSEHSSYALEVAAQLAKQHGAELLVLHMLGLSESGYDMDETSGMAEARYYMKMAKKRFNEFLDKEYLKGLSVDQMVQNYKIFSELNHVAEEQEIDLIVMGSHGTNVMGGFFVGSNTEKVIRSAEVPVLVIKKQTPNFGIKQVVFACDFNLENEGAYLKAMKLFHRLGVKVHLLYVNLPNTQFKSTMEIEEKMANFLFMVHDGKPVLDETPVCVCDHTIEMGIYRYCKKVNADLLAIPTHGRQGISHFFRQSLAEDIANHIDLPVMTFRI